MRTLEQGEDVRESGKQTRCWAQVSVRAQRKRQTTAGCHKGKQARYSEHFFCASETGVFNISQSHNRSKGRAHLYYILLKKGGRRLLRSVDVHRPRVEASKLNRNLVYAKVRIPRRLALDHKTREEPRKLRGWPT